MLYHGIPCPRFDTALWSPHPPHLACKLILFWVGNNTNRRMLEDLKSSGNIILKVHRLVLLSEVMQCLLQGSWILQGSLLAVVIRPPTDCTSCCLSVIVPFQDLRIFPAPCLANSQCRFACFLADLSAALVGHRLRETLLPVFMAGWLKDGRQQKERTNGHIKRQNDTKNKANPEQT